MSIKAQSYQRGSLEPVPAEIRCQGTARRQLGSCYVLAGSNWTRQAGSVSSSAGHGPAAGTFPMF